MLLLDMVQFDGLARDDCVPFLDIGWGSGAVGSEAGCAMSDTVLVEVDACRITRSVFEHTRGANAMEKGAHTEYDECHDKEDPDQSPKSSSSLCSIFGTLPLCGQERVEAKAVHEVEGRSFFGEECES